MFHNQFRAVCPDIKEVTGDSKVSTKQEVEPIHPAVLEQQTLHHSAHKGGKATVRELFSLILTTVQI